MYEMKIRTTHPDQITDKKANITAEIKPKMIKL